MVSQFRKWSFDAWKDLGSLPEDSRREAEQLSHPGIKQKSAQTD